MGRRTEARNHPRLLLVEGDDDKRFVPELVELGIGDGFQWERDGGHVVFIEPQGGVEPLLAQGTIAAHLSASGREALAEPDELHTFVNPQGDVFELVRFSRADGAAAFGESSMQFTWYPGHAWRYAGCRGCGAQLGWRFEGASSFWGLVRTALQWP
jgi:hypothetical protein